MNVFRHLTLRQKMTYCAHLFKVLTKQHHKPLIPLLEKFISKDAVVIDVGGHAGQMTKIFCKLASLGRVYTFEPGSYAYSILSKTKRFKKLNNLEIFKEGISSKEGTVHFHVPIKKSGSIGYGISHIHLEDHKVMEGRYIEEKIKVTTLDTFISSKKLKKVSFIKIDVEGHELEVLRGAEKVLAESNPAIMIEINSEHLSRSKTSKHQIFDYLEKQGYTSARIIDESGTLVHDHNRDEADFLFL